MGRGAPWPPRSQEDHTHLHTHGRAERPHTGPSRPPQARTSASLARPGGAPWLPWGSRAGSWQPPRVGWSLGSTPPAPMPAPSHGHGALPSRLPPQTPMVLPESPHLVINFIIIQPLLPTPKFITQSKLAEIH